MKQLRQDQGFREIKAPQEITDVIFRASAFGDLVRTIKEDPSRSMSPDAMGGVTIDHVRAYINSGIHDGVVDQNLLVPIRPKDFANQLRGYVNGNWPELQEIPLSPDVLNKGEKTGIRKEFSIPPFHDERYPIAHLLSMMTMSFYKRVQRAMIAELEQRNCVIGTDSVVKKNIFRTNEPLGHIVKLSPNPTKRKTPLIVPRHPNFIETGLFPLRKADGTEGLMVLNEDISGAKRLDKFDYEELPLEDRLIGILETMRGCAHLHEQGFVYHDIKPSNIFQIANAGMHTHWILGDSETVVEQGAKYTNNMYYATEAYLDAMYYPYQNRTNMRADKAIDIFAYAMTILEQYIGDEQKFDEFTRVIKEGIGFTIDLDLVEYTLKEVGANHRVPFKVKELLADMLKYDRATRPRITRVYEILTKNI